MVKATSKKIEKEETLPPQAVLTQMLMGYMVSQAVSVAARLHIADHLQYGAKTADELAELTNTHAPSIYRLLRCLASVGIFRKDPQGRFENTELGELLRSDHPESMRATAHMICDPEHWNAHGNMLQSVKTGEIAFDYTFGKPVFTFFAEHPEAGERFDNAMTSFSQTVARAVAETYDFSDAGTIADIGGGHGLLLSKVLQTVPQARGILFDQPQVVAGADKLLQREKTAERVELVGGDFFREIPVRADIYLLKFIIHDWNDAQSETILGNLAEYAEKGSKVLLVETVIEADDNQPSISKVMDVNMLVMTGGRERTAEEYADLFEKTGFRFSRVIPTESPLQIVEAIRV